MDLTHASATIPYLRSPPKGLRLLAALLRNPIEVWEAQHFEELAVIVRTPFGNRLILSKPAAIRRVLVENAANYVRDPIQMRVLRRVTGTGIFTSSGDNWRTQRKAMAPFLSPSAVRGYAVEMRRIAEDFALQLIDSKKKQVCAYDELGILAMRMLERNLFPNGLAIADAQTAAADVQHVAVTMGTLHIADLFGLPTWLPGIRKIAGHNTATSVRRRSAAMVEQERRCQASQASLITKLLKHCEPNSCAGLSIRQVEDNVSTLLGAGTDTTASALIWAIILLSEEPAIRISVEQEGRFYIQEQCELEQLVWTRAVIEEAMRLFPPAPIIGRMALSDDEAAGVRIPRGCEVIIAPWIVHRHRKLWSSPDEFKPERFLPENRKDIPRFAYLPFGAGPRACPGMHFAIQEMILVLVCLCTSVRLDRLTDQVLKLQQYVTLQPAGRYFMDMHPNCDLSDAR